MKFSGKTENILKLKRKTKEKANSKSICKEELPNIRVEKLFNASICKLNIAKGLLAREQSVSLAAAAIQPFGLWPSAWDIAAKPNTASPMKLANKTGIKNMLNNDFFIEFKYNKF